MKISKTLIDPRTTNWQNKKNMIDQHSLLMIDHQKVDDMKMTQLLCARHSLI